MSHTSPEIPIQITYHSQRSSTARIRSGKIVLRISNLVSRREQQRHIDDLLEKMMKEWGKGKEKIALSLRSVFEEGEILLSTGVDYRIQVKKTHNEKCKIQKIGNMLMVLVPIGWREFDADEAELALWKFLVKDQREVLKQRLNDLRVGWIGEEFSVVRLREVMSRWGSCDKRRGIIMLSVKLLLVEPKLLDYVCVHELAHLRYADHSDLFWNLVSQKMPDWKVQRKRLRGYE
ncbi:MAG: DUF45 domain-containing protein [bacterium]|nr:DUF45 domain-containing protein [bacterium]